MVPGIGEWHHVVVTFDGVSGQSAIYDDGEKVDVSFTTPAGVGTADTGGFHIGTYREGSDRFFEGLIDEVGIWNRVLREDEIAYLAEGNPITTSEAPTLRIVNNGDGNVTVTFEGKLQGAPTVNGPWQDATALLPGWDGSSPVTIPASEAQFYGRAVK